MRGRSLVVFLLLSMVSFFADMTYEGARGIAGPYLEMLGASLVVAGVVSLGDAVSYLSRLAAGVLAYRRPSPGLYWGLVFLGYAVNLVAVPLLAYVYSWEAGLALLIIERVGKGLRAPTRDAILSEVGAGLGSGKLFGLHEVLDQAGAVSGALLVGYVASGSGVREALLFLAAPAGAALLLLAGAYLLYPRPGVAAGGRRGVEVVLKHALLLAAPLALSMALFVHWVAAGYVLSGRLEGYTVAYLYALAMAADAVVALPLGALYDRIGRWSLAVLPAASAAATLSLVTAPGPVFAVLWGVAMAGYETLAKAYIADRSPPGERAFAFGVAYSVMGFAWTGGNLVLALLLS